MTTETPKTLKFQRGTIEVVLRYGSDDSDIRDGYVLPNTPWSIARTHPKAGEGWSVFHHPTGLAIHSNISTLKAAKNLIAALTTAIPPGELHALAAQPWATIPSKLGHPEAYAEAERIRRFIQHWQKANKPAS